MLVQQGLNLHQRGNLNDAQNIYEQILSIQENNFDALQLLGALFAQVKKYPQAIKFLSKAIIVLSKEEVLSLAHTKKTDV